jgi:PAS domain S-box-containing protein
MSTPDSLRWLKQPAFLNYGAAVLSVTAALAIARLLHSHYDYEPFAPFLCAVMFSAWFGGARPGLLAMAFSLLVFDYYLLIPTPPLEVEKDMPRLLVAALTALFIVWLSVAQRRATETLRENELRLRQITENIREVFWMAPPAMDEMLYVSPAYESIWGRSLESLRQRPQSFFEAIHAEDRAQATGIIKGQREQGFDIEYRVVRPDGTMRLIHDRGFPVKDASGRVSRIAGIAEDITERKKAHEALWRSERKLHEREEFYRILTENANDFIRVHDLDGRSSYASPSVLRLLGQEPAYLFEFAHPEDLKICQSWWQRVLAGSQERLFWRVRDRDGSWHWMETQGSLIQHDGRSHVMTVCRDVTERKKAEEALGRSERTLREREELYRMLTENANDFIRLHDLDGRSIYASPSVLRLYGQEPAQLFEFAHPEDLEICRQWWKRVLAGAQERIIWRIRDRDGASRWLETQGSLVQHDGRPHVMTVCRDVTEQKEAHEALRQREFDLAEAQRIAHIGSWVTDVATNAIRGSEELYRIFEVDGTFGDKNEIFWSMVHPDDRGRISQLIAEAETNGKPFEVEYRIKTRSGQQKHIRTVGHARTDAAGAVTARFGTSQDVTRQKEAEAALKQAEDRIRLVIDTIPTMAWSVRPDGVVDFVNRRWLDYTGLTLEEEIKKPTASVHPEDLPRVVENWLASKAAGKLSEDEMRLRRADGQYRWFLIRTAPLRDEHGNIVKWFGSSSDIEDRKEAEEALRRSKQQLRALGRRVESLQEEDRKRIAREIHDDLGAKLTALKMDLQWLERKLGEPDKRANNALLDRAVAATELANEAILTVQRLARELRPDVLDKLGLAAAFQFAGRELGERTGIVCTIQVPAEELSATAEQATALYRILQECLTNIVRHSRATRTDVQLSGDDRHLFMRVQDNGRGIEPAVIGDPQSLGLLGMRERVLLLGGEVSVKRAPEGGTVVAVLLPRLNGIKE